MERSVTHSGEGSRFRRRFWTRIYCRIRRSRQLEAAVLYAPNVRDVLEIIKELDPEDVVSVKKALELLESDTLQAFPFVLSPSSPS